MKRLFLILFVWSFVPAGGVWSVSANENGMMSTFGETAFPGMNGVMETYYVDGKNEEDFNGIRTEIEPQHENTARGLNGVMDVFDPNTDALASAHVSVKKIIDIPSVNFTLLYPVNGFNVDTQDISDLQKSLVILKSDQVQKIYLTGYADPTGSAAYNLILSKRRAEYAAKWLISQGVSSAKIKITGAGVDRLQDDYQQARRVEISVLFK